MLKIKGLAAEDLNGFLDEGTEFSGELRFRDMLRVDGRIKGRIVSDNTLIIGETGQVDAEIDCGVVSIRGKVTGQVHGRKRIELLSGLPGPGDPRLPQARDRGRGVLPGGLPDGGAARGGRPRPAGERARPSMVLCIEGRVLAP